MIKFTHNVNLTYLTLYFLLACFFVYVARIIANNNVLKCDSSSTIIIVESEYRKLGDIL